MTYLAVWHALIVRFIASYYVLGYRVPVAVLPTMAVALVPAWVVSRKFGTWFRVSRVFSFLILLWTVLFFAVTLAPRELSQFSHLTGTSRSCQLAISSLDLGGMIGDQQRLLNALLLAPLGFLVVWAPPLRRTLLLIGAVFTMPVIAEFMQFWISTINRACDVLDVADGWVGGFAGAVLGLVLVKATRSWGDSDQR